MTAATVHLTLLVPELIWPEPGDQLTLGNLALPGLAWLLARGQLQRRPADAFENILAGRFGLNNAPFGALRLLGEADGQLARNGHWLCADPVHLRFHHERIVLADAGAFELGEDEALTLIEALNGEFADMGKFHMATSRRWYLRLNAAVDHPVEPLSAIAGKRIAPDLPGKAAPLTRWLNEVQMFLHNHALNDKRQAAGHPAVNSLWLWGGGPLPSATHAGNTTVCSDNPLAIGLARATGVTTRPRPASLTALLDQATDEAPFVVLDQMLPPVLYEDSEGWRQAATELDQHWFVPLRSALGRRVKRLTLIAPTIYGCLEWQFTGAERWKFWRKERPLAAIANELAEQFAEGKPA